METLQDTNDQPIKRITFKSIGLSILSVLNFEKGIFYTLKELSIRPGTTILTYLFKDRSKILEPVRFLFVMIALGALVFIQFQLEDLVLGYDAYEKDGTGEIFRTIVSKYYNLFLLFIIPFFSLASIWIFSKKKLNAAEHLILNTYIFSYQTFIYIITTLALNWTKYEIVLILPLCFIFQVIVYIKVFEQSYRKGILLTFLVLILSLFLYILTAMFFLGLLVGYNVAASQ